ncbi:MAG: hypothetical protein ACP5L4_00175 [Thermoplasmata archaeon]
MKDMKRVILIFSIIILLIFNVQPQYVNDTGKYISSNISYAINFSERGLPEGYLWYVNVNGTVKNSTSSSIIFSFPNGTYNFTVYSKNKDLYPVPAGGSFNVSGKNITIDILFKWNNYTINFTESGLPSKTEWYVNLNGTTKYSTSNYIDFYLPNGTYDFNVNTSSIYSPSPPSGKISVNGSNQTVSITFTYNAYNVTFIEYGLPTNTLWGIYLGRGLYKTTTNSVTISLKNGTYTYFIYDSNKDYYTRIPNGIVTVSGTSQTIFVFFQPYYSKIYFNETGIPVNTTWYVNVNGTTYQTDRNSIMIEEMNGTYYFYISSSNKNYYPNPSKGIFNATGKTVTIKISFLPYYYTINFTAVGLPSGTTWGLIYNRTYQTTGNYIIMKFINGTYNLSVFDNNSNFMPENRVMEINVNGSNENIQVYFMPVLYPVVFQEYGLPMDTLWYVNISGKTYITENSSVTIYLQNGSYYYTVSSENKIYYTEQFYGNFTLNGSIKIIKIYFQKYLLQVNFTESGLPSWITWSISVDSIKYYSNTTYLVIYLTNGSYRYIPSSSDNIYYANPGYINVSGENMKINVLFYELNYTLIFYASSVPKYTYWGVNLSNGMRKITYLHEIVFNLTNGTYYYNIWIQNSSYAPTQSSGSVIILGKGENISISFRYLIFSVNFVENGLPSKYSWYINIGGENLTTNSQNVSFKIMIGQYKYYYGTLDRKYSCGEGFINVSKNITIFIKFVPEKYQVIFYESGLMAGTLWEIVLNGTTYSSAYQNIDLMLFNGTYIYSIKSVSGYIPLNTGGIIKVDGKPISVMIGFSVQMYLITITLSNVQFGTNWSVNVIGREFNGQSVNLVFYSDKPTMTFYLPNGSYTYYINLPNNYISTSYKGSFIIYGGAVSEYSQAYYIPFQTMILYTIWFISGLLGFTIAKIKTNKKK